jgi:hypothetical protein
MNQAGIDVNSIRKGLPANVDPDAATRSILAMNARSLTAQGVSIDPQTGKVVGSLSSIFRDNPLVGSSPTLSKQLARYVSSYDGWLNGIDLGAKRTEGTQIAPSGSPYDMARSNLVNLRPVPGKPGVFENDFLRNDNGTVTFKSQAEIKQTDDLRKAQLASAVGTALRAKNDPVLGPRMVDGKRVVSGSQLPATMGALQHFGPWIQSIANTFRNDAGQGGVYRMKVNRVGTGETGTYKVINLGNIRSITRNFWEPFEYSVSSQGHLLAHTIDDSAVQRNVLKGINEGILPHHNNDASAVHQSLMTYLSNHKQGLPSENAIGIGKRNEINALLTSFSKNHRNINPLAANFGPQGVVRRIRMDRIEDMSRVVNQDKGSPTYGQPLAGFHFDYFKVNNNMMPDVVPSGNAIIDQYESASAKEKQLTDAIIAHGGWSWSRGDIRDKLHAERGEMQEVMNKLKPQYLRETTPFYSDIKLTLPERHMIMDVRPHVVFRGEEVPPKIVSVEDTGEGGSSRISSSEYPVIRVRLSNGAELLKQVRFSDHGQVSQNAPREYDVDFRDRLVKRADKITKSLQIKMAAKLQPIVDLVWNEQRGILENANPGTVSGTGAAGIKTGN